MNKIDEITNKQFWDDHAADIEYLTNLSRGEDPLIAKIMGYIQSILPSGRGRSFFEIGCYPGRFLAMFSERMGYEVSGIDFTDKAPLLAEELRNIGVRLREIINEDFFNYEITNKYDVVASFGFIEHFINYENVIARHLKLVKPSGYVIIGVPNLNNPIHAIINRKLLKYHNRAIMDCDRISNYIQRSYFQIIFSDYIINKRKDHQQRTKHNYILTMKDLYINFIIGLANIIDRIQIENISLRKIIIKYLIPGYILCIAKNMQK